MAKCSLRVPKANPSLHDEYLREDDQLFIWNGIKWRKELNVKN